MTDEEKDELEQLDSEDRIKRLDRKDAFQLNNEHMDIICNVLFSNDDDGDRKIGKIMRDLLAFNVDGTTDLIDNGDPKDSADMTARRLLMNDAIAYQNKWLLRSLHNSQNRQGKTKEHDEQVDEQSTDTTSDSGCPTMGDVMSYAHMILGGVPEMQVDSIARNWYDNMTKNHWCDDRGEKIRNWRKVFESYCDSAWRKAGK